VYVFTVRLCFTVKNSYYFTNHHILAWIAFIILIWTKK
jgi:hypothetical protein